MRARGVSGKPSGSKQTGQAVYVVAVKMRDKDARQLAETKVASQDLMLRRFTAIHQPPLAALRKSHGDSRNIAPWRRYAAARSKESYLHLVKAFFVLSQAVRYSSD